MTNFDKAREALIDSRHEVVAAQEALARARQGKNKLENSYTSLLRSLAGHEDDPRLEKLKEQLKEANLSEQRLRDGLKTAKKQLDIKTGLYGEIADPRKAIENWPDDIPVLLFPVRLETRFKHIVDRAGERDELWVRIYPDECIVDTFEATLSDVELTSAKRYWIETWAAGGVDAQRRSAWRNLVASHGIGRAAWIVKEFIPLNINEEPVKDLPEDIILVIGSETILPEVERDALADYWKAAWIAENDKDQVDAATAALAAAIGVDDVTSLIAQYEPTNFATTPTPPASRNELTLSVAWIHWPADPSTKTRSWTAPPRVKILPDRFIILGYQADKVVFEALGGMISYPLVAGPDPSAPKEEQIKHDESGDLTVPEEMSWMVDFDAAIKAGMGVRVPLDPTRVNLNSPIDRVIALGVRLSDGADEGRIKLEELLTHHRYGRAGFAFVSQGTPTNNTDTEGAGYSRVEDADASYGMLHGADQFVMTDVWWQRSDGQWLADALGVNPDILKGVPGAGGMDCAEARALNRALWPATLGYATETMLHPVFNEDQVNSMRWYYTHFVSGRGFLPSLRVGAQPYGVLPVSALSQWTWLSGDRLLKVGGLDPPDNLFTFLKALSRVLNLMRTDWAELSQSVKFIGKTGDPHDLLLDVIGLHPASVEFHQRYAESLQHIFNRAKLGGLAAQIIENIRMSGLQQQAIELLHKLGYTGSLDPDALSKFFFSRSNRINGPLIDDRPLSEQEPIRPYTEDGKHNYIEWLIDTARNAFEDLRLENGFKDNRSPDALLYILLRHALLLGYWDSSLRLHLAANVMTADEVKIARREPAFIHVVGGEVVGGEAQSESRYKFLYSSDPHITQSPDRTVAEYVREFLGKISATRSIADQLEALEQLKNIPTARLERCLAEHIDTASFRLDAWLLGLIHYQLSALRYRSRSGSDVNLGATEVETRHGIYLGAYGWLENLQRKSVPLQPVKLDEELIKVFAADGAPPLQYDPSNGGYILAPSLNQATTAAILRAGYLSNATPQTPGTLAVNLSSARVRVALGLIEGIRNGQPLGALLGYRFQRGLHEGHPPLELDKFIYPLRKKFPLVANQLTSTVDQQAPIETIEANNVVDGLKLIDHVRRSGNRSYPFGLSLPPANAAERSAIDSEVDKILDAYDALADLALAEGVHQAVLGNYDRVSATLDAYSKGTFPPEPEVVRTPRSGLTLTHRVALHFKAGIDPESSPFDDIAVTPRSKALSMVNDWLAGVLPKPSNVGCVVRWADPKTGSPQEEPVSQLQLQLQPIDLLYICTLDAEKAMSELDDRILKQVIAARSPRADAVLTIHHTTRLAPPMITFFELAPLIRHLRSLLLRSRPLLPSDISLPQETQRKNDQTQKIERDTVKGVWDLLDELREDLSNTTIAPPVDTAIAKVAEFFDRASRYGIQQVGWGFLYEWRRRTYAELISRLKEVLSRWEDRLSQFEAGLIDYGNLPPATGVDERFAALGKLDLLVSANTISPRPQSPADYFAALPARRNAFAAKKVQLKALTDTNNPLLAPLLSALQGQLPLTNFDNTPFSIDDIVADIDLFIQDLKARFDTLKAEVQRRLNAATDQLSAHDVSADPAARVQALQKAGSALLGDDVPLIPEFMFNAELAAELTNCYTESGSGALTNYLKTQKEVEFPVEDWLHGVARVREKLKAWEQMVALATTFGSAETALTPIQLPYRAGEGWFGLEFDPAIKPEGERLLYTAHHATAPEPSEATCGLLIDEWTEVIPSRDETAGLTFQYDRPGSEPPQAWLLVTPAHLDGHWQWSELLGALHETLDLARLRAVEPAQIETRTYARFLPATTSAVTLYGVSIAANLARANQVMSLIKGGQ